MSNGKGKNNIPWFLIVIGWIAFWPAGLVLTILKIVFDLDTSSNKSETKIENKQNSSYTYNAQTQLNNQQNNQNTQNAKQGNRYSYQYQNTYQNRQQNPNVYSQQPQYQQPQQQPQSQQQHQFQQQPQSAQPQQQQQQAANLNTDFNTQKYVPNRKKIGKSALSILLVILGCCLLLPTMIISIDSVVNLFSGIGFSQILQYFIVSGAFAASTFASFVTANIFRQRNSTFMRYQAIIGDRMSVYIPKLAVKMDVKYKKAVKDLQTMIDKGYFGSRAYIDSENHQLFIDPSAAPEAIVEKEEREPVFVVSETETEADDGLEGEEFKALLAQIREANKAIDDVEVSEKISRIEEITRVIFAHVEENPAKKPKIHTFMDYYLPTTLKLLKSYSQIEKIDLDTENIKSARENIEKILDLLVTGFEQQIDQLYETEEMDISADIDVLEQMMYVDGLASETEYNIPKKPDETTGAPTSEQESQDDILNSYSDEITDYIEGLTGGSATMQKPEDK